MKCESSSFAPLDRQDACLAVAERLARDGFAVFERVVPVSVCEALSEELTSRFESQQDSARARIGGVRNLLRSCPLVAEFADSPSVKNILSLALGVEAFPVRSIFFDKTPDANWSVAWHQDLHIAVAEKIETPGFGPWTVKAGVPHVQPPLTILDGMVTIRLHLDDCDETNGAVKVVPGSHAEGILSDAKLGQWKQREAVMCAVPRGGVLLMRPLLLHSSSPALKPAHRRVLHIEYARMGLPNGLQWFERK